MLHRLRHINTIKEPHLPYKTGLDVTQSHPLHRTHFGQYQASPAALGCIFAVRMSPTLNEVVCYSVLNVVTWSNCAISTRDCHNCLATVVKMVLKLVACVYTYQLDSLVVREREEWSW